MESSQYFTLLVLAVCALHLISSTCKSIGTCWHSSQEKKWGIAKGLNLGTQRDKATIRQRSDWYVFFHCSDLTGDSPKPHPFSSRLSKRKISDINNATLKNRPQVTARRPRVSMDLS